MAAITRVLLTLSLLICIVSTSYAAGTVSFDPAPAPGTVAGTIKVGGKLKLDAGTTTMAKTYEVWIWVDGKEEKAYGSLPLVDKGGGDYSMAPIDHAGLTSGTEYNVMIIVDVEEGGAKKKVRCVATKVKAK